MLIKVTEYQLVVLTGDLLMPLFHSHLPFYAATIDRCVCISLHHYRVLFTARLCIPVRDNWWSVQCLGSLLIYYSQIIEVHCV